MTRAHLVTDRPFNISGPDRQCQAEGCGAEAGFFQSAGRWPATGLPIIAQRWCRRHLPAGWMPVRRAA